MTRPQSHLIFSLYARRGKRNGSDQIADQDYLGEGGFFRPTAVSAMSKALVQTTESHILSTAAASPVTRWPLLCVTPHLIRRLVLSQPDVNRMAQKVIGRPSQIGDLRDELWLDPVGAREDERRAEACAARRWDAQR